MAFKRFCLENKHICLKENENGEWVLYEDVKEIEKRNEQLLEENFDLEQEVLFYKLNYRECEEEKQKGKERFDGFDYNELIVFFNLYEGHDDNPEHYAEGTDSILLKEYLQKKLNDFYLSLNEEELKKTASICREYLFSFLKRMKMVHGEENAYFVFDALKKMEDDIEFLRYFIDLCPKMWV